MIIRRAGFMGAAYGVLLQSALAVAQPGLPDPNTVLLSEHVINLSLAEAVALGMRSNYSIRSLKPQASTLAREVRPARGARQIQPATQVERNPYAFQRQCRPGAGQ